ncbi:MAG TPA: hypothetical protein VFC79_08555 [Tissierellaceae bacterium]|nr:hypothetical protein [Tissierellaceae bacterium]
MRKSMLIIGISAAAFIIIAYLVGGSGLVLEGFNISMRTANQSALMLLASFVVIGQIQVLLSKEMLDRWLQKFSGIKGIIISALAGGLFPGGPYIYYPFVLSFKEKELPFYIFVSFVFGKHVYDFSRFPMEMSLINPNIAVIRNLITLPIPIIVGMLAQRYFNNKTMETMFVKVGDHDDSNHNNP